MNRAKSWALRRARALVQEAVTPALQEAAPPVLEHVATRVLQQVAPLVLRELTPAVLQQVSTTVLQQVTPAVLQQVTPAVLQEVTTAVLQQAVPAVLQQVIPAVLQEVTSAVLQQVTPAVLQQVMPAVLQEVTTAVLQQVTPAVLQQVMPAVLQEVTTAVLQQVTPAVLQQVMPAVLREVTTAVLQEVTPAILQQVASTVLEQVAPAVLAQVVPAAVERAARPGLDAIAAAQARHLAELAGTHAQQLESVALAGKAQIDRLHRALGGQQAFSAGHAALLEQLRRERRDWRAGMLPEPDVSERVRRLVRKHAGLAPQARGDEGMQDLLTELRFLWTNSALVRPMLEVGAGKRVLYSGQAYYNAWYLSRALRELGWKADVLNWDGSTSSQIYYHGEDFHFRPGDDAAVQSLRFYVAALYGYDVFHFSNAHGISFGTALAQCVEEELGPQGEIHMLKALGHRIVYSNNGCLDGASQSGFSRWGPESVCAICRWRDEPSVCSDERNLEWGYFRNSVADYQCTLGGNRIDYNDDPRVHEVPGFYCLDPETWRPELEIPPRFRLPRASDRTLWLYHGVGHRQSRTLADGVNIKSSHVWLPLIDKLRGEGWDLQLMEPEGVPNREVRFLQAQADIFVEMLTYGWFGANAREAMMLGKPVICYIRPEWLESVREELPEYAADLPIVSATPDTAEEVLLDLMRQPDKRAEIGRRGREFMLRWHTPQAGARHFDDIYSRLVRGEQVLRPAHAGPQRTVIAVAPA
jgi:hypothetical protein